MKRGECAIKIWISKLSRVFTRSMKVIVGLQKPEPSKRAANLYTNEKRAERSTIQDRRTPAFLFTPFNEIILEATQLPALNFLK